MKIFVTDSWRGNFFTFENNSEPIIPKEVTCPRCQCKYVFGDDKNIPDKCLGKLPGVSFACCGHGVEKGYIKFENGVIIRGYFNVEYPR